VLTEMLGVLLVRREAARLGLLTPPPRPRARSSTATRRCKSKAGAGDVTYDQFVQTVQKRSLKELLESEQFGAEVLLRLISERRWTRTPRAPSGRRTPSASRRRPSRQVELTGRDAGGAAPRRPRPRDWESTCAHGLARLRQDMLRALFKQSRIVRRF
jgi:hypothetical protein